MERIQAIETVYKGYSFRSRLEARWAVFFDVLGFSWEYEKEGYYVGWVYHEENCQAMKHPYREKDCDCTAKRTMYLPDFWLKDTETWVEVKGDYQNFDFDSLVAAVDWGVGLPYVSDSTGTARGLLLLGSIPQATSYFWPTHPILQHNKGGWANTANFSDSYLLDVESTYEVYFDSSWGGGYEDLEKFVKKYWSAAYGYRKKCPSEIVKAYKAARSARFEHGESG